MAQGRAEKGCTLTRPYQSQLRELKIEPEFYPNCKYMQSRLYAPAPASDLYDVGGADGT